MAKKLVQLDIDKIKQKGEFQFLILDLFMVVVVVVNLLWIIFDWHFQFNFVQSFFRNNFYSFYEWYKYRVRPDFLLYDMYFVVIFITELIARWIVAIVRNTYHRWYWYPFIHWYDVLGCIPLGSFRFLRLFRLLSITIRLHKLEIIDLRKSYLYSMFKKYYNIVVEEISDRVVVNVLDSWQESIKEGGPVMDRIKAEVLLPKKDDLVNWASQRLIKATEDNYLSRRDEIKESLDMLIRDALENNDDVRSLKRIPIVGKSLVEQLEKRISSASFGMLDGAMKEIGSENNKVFLNGAANMLFAETEKTDADAELDRIAKKIAIESIEVIKDDVKVQKWKVEEEKKKKIKERARAIKKAKEQGIPYEEIPEVEDKQEDKAHKIYEPEKDDNSEEGTKTE